MNRVILSGLALLSFVLFAGSKAGVTSFSGMEGVAHAQASPTTAGTTGTGTTTHPPATSTFAAAPTVSLTTDTLSVVPGTISGRAEIVLKWDSTGAASCSTSFTVGEQPLSGSVTLAPNPGTTEYRVRCTGTNGDARAKIKVRVIGTVRLTNNQAAALPSGFPGDLPLLAGGVTADDQVELRLRLSETGEDTRVVLWTGCQLVHRFLAKGTRVWKQSDTLAYDLQGHRIMDQPLPPTL